MIYRDEDELAYARWEAQCEEGYEEFDAVAECTDCVKCADCGFWWDPGYIPGTLWQLAEARYPECPECDGSPE